MNKGSKLAALTGEGDILGGTSTSDTWGYNVKARHVYDGTDSEDEEPEIPINRRARAEPSLVYDHPGRESGMGDILNLTLFRS